MATWSKFRYSAPSRRRQGSLHKWRRRNQHGILRFFAAGSLIALMLTPLVWAAAKPGIYVYPTSTLTLRTLGQQRGIYMGAAVNYDSSFQDARAMNLFKSQYRSLTSENQMKWPVTEPTQNTFDFTKADALLNVSLASSMKVRGHNLAWDDEPSWLANLGNHQTTFTGAQVQAILENHITQVMTHFKTNYPGMVISWDVVNEPYSNNVDGSNNFLPRTTVFNKIGTGPLDYIAVAFNAARAADPDAVLCLNDYANQGGLSSIPWTNRATQEFNLISSLKSQGVPIDCVGMEMHLGDGGETPSNQGVLDLMNLYETIGVSVQITEFDVGIQTQSAPNLATQSTLYHDMLEACVASANCTSFTTWGFTDKYSWVPSGFPGYGFALPFDSAFHAKPAYTGMVNALLGL